MSPTAAGVEALVLAGFMRILGPEAIARFPHRILNIHPSLLPAFPGVDAVGQALRAGVQVTGVTVHFVDERVDHGPDHRPASCPGSARRRRGFATRADSGQRARDLSARRAGAGRGPTAGGQWEGDLVVTRIPVRRALVSVHDKTGLIEFGARLSQAGVEIVSSGGTAAALATAGIAVTLVSDVTKAAEMLGGRVKTLHPSIHGGILARLSDPEHRRDLETHGIEPFELVVVNLYPFEATVAVPFDLMGRGHRADRHRRADYDPVRRQEPGLRRRGHVARTVRTGRHRDRGRRSRTGNPTVSGQECLLSHRLLRRRHRQLARTAATSPPDWRSRSTGRQYFDTAKTPTSRPGSIEKPVPPPGGRERG